MKFLKILIFQMCLMANSGYGAAPTCSKDEILKFKNDYVQLQNALKYEGKNIELKNNKVKAIGEATSADNSPGKKAEEVLYKNYKNALIKVQKIYQHLNKETLNSSEKELKSNPEITNFFKALDPQNAETNADALKINIHSLLESLKTANVPGFKLEPEDTYLLEKLLVHSQDRICTLDKYDARLKKSNSYKVQYLEQLRKSPLNKMIESLRKLAGTENLNLANENIALETAVKDSLNKLRETIQKNRACEKSLANLNIGERIQACNYDRFLKSLSAAHFNEFESILHFINANQQAANARTSLDWINAQFKQETFSTCFIDPNTKSVYVQNMPLLKDNKTIDASKFSCVQENITLTGSACVDGLDISFENGKGHKAGLKKDSKISTISIANSSNCANISLIDDKKAEGPAESLPKQCDKSACEKLVKEGATFSWNDTEKACYEAPVVNAKDTKKVCSADAVATVPQETEKSCAEKTPAQKFNKDKNSCEPITLSDEEKCKEQNKEWINGAKTEDGIRTDRYSWNGKECKDKQSKKESEEKGDETPEDTKSETVYPNKPVPGRFQPVNIPTRQIYILPGMP